MKTYKNLWNDLCNYENLELAFKKARKHKTLKYYVLEFENNLEDNLLQLRYELLFYTYKPNPLKTFIIKDPKTRKISKSKFRDRVVHHALVNILEPILDKTFIYDSYANRKDKGTLKALKRFDCFKRKISHNNTKKVYVLKPDIKHYFETVNHEVLLNLIKRKIKDNRVIWLIKIILENYYFKEKNKGMPLGNLTSQFFANIYLNELDRFVKHELRAKYYIRYVDDFVILHENKNKLNFYKNQIKEFLKNNLKIELHKDKSKIFFIRKGITFLGFRHFYFYTILNKNKRKHVNNKIKDIIKEYKEMEDYKKLMQRFESILSHLEIGNTYYLRNNFIVKLNNNINMLNIKQ